MFRMYIQYSGCFSGKYKCPATTRIIPIPFAIKMVSLISFLITAIINYFNFIHSEKISDSFFK